MSVVKKIYLSGGWGYGNIGDNAILKSMLTSLEQALPNSEILITSNSVNEISFHHKKASINSIHSYLLLTRRNIRISVPWNLFAGILYLLTGAKCASYLRRHQKLITHSDIVILGGGGYFNSAWLTMWLAQAVTIKFASTSAIPVIIYAQSLGPFSDAELPFALKSIHAAAIIICRDQTSYQRVLTPSSKSRTYLTADEANLIVGKSTNMMLAPNRINIGIILQNFRLNTTSAGRRQRGAIDGQKSYIRAFFKALVDLSSSLDCNFHLLPSTTWDVKTSVALKTLLDEQNIRANLSTGLPIDEYIRAIHKANLIISTNMHPIIIAATAGIPSVALTYNFKVDDYMESLGMENHVYSISDFVSDDIVNSVKNIVRNHDEYSALIRDRVATLQTKARLNRDLLNQLVEGS